MWISEIWLGLKNSVSRHDLLDIAQKTSLTTYQYPYSAERDYGENVNHAFEILYIFRGKAWIWKSSIVSQVIKSIHIEGTAFWQLLLIIRAVEGSTIHNYHESHVAPFVDGSLHHTAYACIHTLPQGWP